MDKYVNFCMIQFFKINSGRHRFNTSIRQNINTIFLNGIEWKSFPELHLSTNNGKYKIEHKFDIENNTEMQTPESIEISIFGSNVKTMKTVATEAVDAKDYKRTISSIIDESSINSQKLKEFIEHFNNPDWFFVYSGFTKIESNAAKSTDDNNYEIQANNSTILNSSSKLYIYDITNFASTDLSKFYPAAFLNNAYFKLKTQQEQQKRINNALKTPPAKSKGGKRNPDRERIYKLPIHKRRTDNYYNYE